MDGTFTGNSASGLCGTEGNRNDGIIQPHSKM